LRVSECVGVCVREIDRKKEGEGGERERECVLERERRKCVVVYVLSSVHLPLSTILSLISLVPCHSQVGFCKKCESAKKHIFFPKCLL